MRPLLAALALALCAPQGEAGTVGRRSGGAPVRAPRGTGPSIVQGPGARTAITSLIPSVQLSAPKAFVAAQPALTPALAARSSPEAPEGARRAEEGAPAPAAEAPPVAKDAIEASKRGVDSLNRALEGLEGAALERLPPDALGQAARRSWDADVPSRGDASAVPERRPLGEFDPASAGALAPAEGRGPRGPPEPAAVSGPAGGRALAEALDGDEFRIMSWSVVAGAGALVFYLGGQFLAPALGWQWVSHYHSPYGESTGVMTGLMMMLLGLGAVGMEEAIFRLGAYGLVRDYLARFAPRATVVAVVGTANVALFTAMHETSDPVMIALRATVIALFVYAYERYSRYGHRYGLLASSGVHLTVNYGMMIPIVLGSWGLAYWPALAVAFAVFGAAAWGFYRAYARSVARRAADSPPLG